MLPPYSPQVRTPLNKHLRLRAVRGYITSKYRRDEVESTYEPSFEVT
jgi:hypothetical protein